MTKQWIEAEMSEVDDKARIRAVFDRYESDSEFQKLVDFIIDFAELPPIDTLEIFEEYPAVGGGSTCWLTFNDQEDFLYLDDACGDVLPRVDSPHYEDDNGNIREWDCNPGGDVCSVGEGSYEDPCIDKNSYDTQQAAYECLAQISKDLTDANIPADVEIVESGLSRSLQQDYGKYSINFDYSGFKFVLRDPKI